MAFRFLCKLSNVFFDVTLIVEVGRFGNSLSAH